MVGGIKMASYARINAGNGTSTIVAAPGTGFKIVVYGYNFTSTIALSVDLRDGDGTVRAGAFATTTGNPVTYPGGPDGGAFECGENQSLDIAVSGLGNVRGHLTYVIGGV
jgi:hypothetical protein